jgi:hypothetical protein
VSGTHSVAQADPEQLGSSNPVSASRVTGTTGVHHRVHLLVAFGEQKLTSLHYSQ